MYNHLMKLIEGEESFEEFMARMSDSLIIEEQSAQDEDALRIQFYKDRLSESYLSQHFLRRKLGEIPEEARRLNTTFPTWKMRREENYRKAYDVSEKKVPMLLELADVTSTLVHSDVARVCMTRKQEFEDKKQTCMPGTDSARAVDDAIFGWGYIADIVSASELMITGDGSTSPQS